MSARTALALAVAAISLARLPTADAAPEPPWCAPELETLPNETCHFTASPSSADAGARRTLVLFLHGVIKPGTDWQHAQQRAIVRGAKTHRFTALVPRGRRGIGPKTMRDWWAWPTGAAAQKKVEARVLEEFAETRALLEKRDGAFDQAFVFGFSNGAFYASSLALRGRLDSVDGYAVFAGGSGADYLKKHGKAVKRRPPIYVGIGKKDRYREDGRRLARNLRALGWRHRVGERNVGHVMADSQVAEAIRFLRTSKQP